jgi:hypothetical protein
MFSDLYKFNKTTLGKTCGTKWGAIGTRVGIHWELDGNTGRTWWEHIGNYKNSIPQAPQKKKEKLCLLVACYNSSLVDPNFYSQLCSSPGFVLFQFCEVCGLMISTWGLSQLWLQVIEESRFCFNPTNTLPIHLSNSLDEVPPRFNFFCCNEPIWLAHHSKKLKL